MTLSEALDVCEDSLHFTRKRLSATVGESWAFPEERAMAVLLLARRDGRLPATTRSDAPRGRKVA